MEEKVPFGKQKISINKIFYRSKFCLGFLSYGPVLPGHALIIPKRKVARYAEMTSDEISDMFLSAQRIGPILEKEYKATSLQLAIQDGRDAGQSIEHCHLHIIPSKEGDFKTKELREIEEERKYKSGEELLKETAHLAKFFPECENYSYFEE